MEQEKQQVIEATKTFIQEKLQGEGSGHDWWHVYRVWKNALHIAATENANLFIVELAALLHDIADWKFYNGDDSMGPKLATEWLITQQVDKETIAAVADIIQHLSFKGAGEKTKMGTIEGMIVQDADRLDAIGAIGIARTFAYGGHKNREMYNPNIKPEFHENFEQYRKNNGSTINHFYEKLLLLKDLMNTKTAKEIAERRHKYMEDFLEEFYGEWNGEY